jgi:hypothetical protein
VEATAVIDGVRVNSTQVSVGVGEIHCGAGLPPRAGERRKMVHFSMWMIPIFLGPVLLAGAMILFYLREAATVDRMRRELVDEDIKAINARVPKKK